VLVNDNFEVRFPYPSNPSGDDTAFFGGFTGYWSPDNLVNLAPEKEMGFNNLTLAPKLTIAIAYASKVVLDDGPALVQLAEDTITSALSYMVTKAMLVGTGAGQPIGKINDPATLTVNRTAGNQIARR